MTIIDFFKKTRNAIANKRFEELSTFQLDKPEYFNWVNDIFYPLNVKAFPETNALIWRYNKQEQFFTFQDIYNRSNQLLNFLRHNGAKKGDHIYTILPLVPDNWTSILATIKGGFILMPTATNMTARDISYRFETLFPEVIISTQKLAESIDEAETQFSQNIKLKILIDGEKEGWHSINAIEKESTEAIAENTKADDPFLYFFTSGTTGLPKVVVHTHFTYPFGHLSTASWINTSHGDIHYNISSPGWAKFAWSSFFAPWNTGATIFANQVDAFIPSEQLKTMEDYKITTFCGSPTVLRMLIQEDLNKYNLKLKTCVAAGEPLNPDVIEKWKQGTGVTIRDGYGQTETTAIVGNIDGELLKPGSMGKPTFLYDIDIFDDDGNVLPPLEEGAICIKMGHQNHNGVFVGYLNDDKRTKSSFKHGLYYTGDKAYKDEDGYIWFVGRDDDVIKASAYRIGPFEVESVLIEHDAVLESAVVASPHNIRGYAVKAFVILKDGISANEALAEELFKFTEKRLAKYKVPRIIEFSKTLPKTISGKIRRIELRANEATDKVNKVKKNDEHFHKKY